MKSTDTSRQGPSDTFRADVTEQVRVSDIALMLTIPFVLTGVYLLPVSIQQSFVVNYRNPSILNLWTAAYVHDGFAHFSGNLAAYVLYILPTYLLFILADERRLFRYTFLSFLVVLPPVLALITITVVGQGIGTGFSGIGSAYIGLLPAALFVFIRNRVSQEVGLSNVVAVFLVVLSVIAAIYTGTLAATGIFVVACLLVIFDIRRVGIGDVRRIGSKFYSMNGYFELIVVAVALFLISPLALFPQQIVQDGHLVNILSHYVGLVFGFFGPIAFAFYRG